ncbi:MAG: hypothetical protein ACP5SE_04080 [Nitrososphaeria archaeon]
MKPKACCRSFHVFPDKPATKGSQTMQSQEYRPKPENYKNP